MKKSLKKVSSKVHFRIQQPKRQKFSKIKRILFTDSGFSESESFYLCLNQIKRSRSNKMILSFPFGYSSFGSILTENCYNNCSLILLIFYHLYGLFFMTHFPHHDYFSIKNSSRDLQITFPCLFLGS